MAATIARRAFSGERSGPLARLRVLDLARLVAGNVLSLQLADFGADVIKIEAPAKGDPLRNWRSGDVPLHWKEYSRNKRSVGLDLRLQQGKEILLRLVETADVLVENYRPGTLEKMGLGPDVSSRQIRASSWCGSPATDRQAPIATMEGSEPWSKHVRLRGTLRP